MGRLVNETTMSQKEIILRHLKRYAGINDDIARDKYGIRRLSGRIFDLRDDGYNITTEYKNGRNRYGKKTRYGVYKLVKS